MPMIPAREQDPACSTVCSSYLPTYLPGRTSTNDLATFKRLLFEPSIWCSCQPERMGWLMTLVTNSWPYFDRVEAKIRGEGQFRQVAGLER